MLSARLSLVIAVAEMGVRLNLLNRELEAQVVMLAIVTSVLAPTLFRALAPPIGAQPVASERVRASAYQPATWTWPIR